MGELTYEIKKYAGYLPVTNELLDDSDAAIANLVVEWLGDEEVATENAQILAKVNEKEATAMTGIDDIKNEMKDQRHTNMQIAERLSAVESSAKQAHHRIDRIEGHMDHH